ncbi:metallophosphoesterase [Anaerosphaera multitolerans]|uniref:Metallophosphoesterase n=1 Tax=Anaerosphaera multitolerans TaxID=2487351 RepID=A0A437S780_9FIRM|nr:metallophosphoesterase [Anaerosphaera multitolerans]RVU54886.1 metallophosphoesterase [Anaerosphaera multitolerans]
MIFLLIFIFYLIFQLSVFKVYSLNFESEKITSEIKITQISDFHDNKLINYKNLKDSIDKFKPDLIVLTGDIINRYTTNLSNVYSLLEIIEDYRVLFVEGNHEVDNLNKSIYKLLEEKNIENISKSNISFTMKSQKINIYGNGFGKENYIKRNLKENEFNLLLTHNPHDFVNNYEKFDLVLSGHTHGGQVRLPILGQILDHGPTLFPKYSKGFYKVFSSLLYIDSGLGQSLYIRINDRISFTNIVLKTPK